jgi:hypothetical protein
MGKKRVFKGSVRTRWLAAERQRRHQAKLKAMKVAAKERAVRKDGGFFGTPADLLAYMETHPEEAAAECEKLRQSPKYLKWKEESDAFGAECNQICRRNEEAYKSMLSPAQLKNYGKSDDQLVAEAREMLGVKPLTKDEYLRKQGLGAFTAEEKDEEEIEVFRLRDILKGQIRE